MPDIRGRREIRSRVADAWWKIYWWGFWSTELAAAGLIAMTATALAVAHIDLQYVVGGLVVVFGRKIATKKLVVPQKTEKPDEYARPVRAMLAGYGDKRAAQMDVDLSP